MNERTMPIPNVPRLCLAVLAGALLISAGAAGQDAGGHVQRLSDLKARRVGVKAGSTSDKTLEEFVEQPDIAWYDSYRSLIAALKNGEIDAVLGDYPALRRLAAADPGLRVLSDTAHGDSYGFGFRYQDKELFGRFNTELLRLKNSGGLGRLVKKWLEGADGAKAPPAEAANGSAPRLRMGAAPVTPPFAFSGPGGAIVGLDVELAQTIAATLGYRLEIVGMEFEKLVPALLAHEIDVVGGAVAITPDRLRSLQFTDDYYRARVGALVLAEAEAESATDYDGAQ